MKLEQWIIIASAELSLSGFELRSVGHNQSDVQVTGEKVLIYDESMDGRKAIPFVGRNKRVLKLFFLISNKPR